MQKGVIHIAGIVGLLFLAAFALPRASRNIENRLEAELDLALSDQSLIGIDGHFDGQILTLSYAPNAIDIIVTNDASQLASRMAEAKQIAEHLTGGLDLPAGNARLWGPVTRISVDQTSINTLARQMEMRRYNGRDYRPNDGQDHMPAGGPAYAEAP